MIQRIQTLYLLIVTALVAVMLFAPLAWFAGQAGEYGLYAFSLRSADGTLAQPTLYLGILLALAAALPLVTIFLYRRRLLQIRLCVAEMVLLAGAVVMEGVYYFLSGRLSPAWRSTRRASGPRSPCRWWRCSSPFWPHVRFSTTNCSCVPPTGFADPHRFRARIMPLGRAPGFCLRYFAGSV